MSRLSAVMCPEGALATKAQRGRAPQPKARSGVVNLKSVHQANTVSNQDTESEGNFYESKPKARQVKELGVAVLISSS